MFTVVACGLAASASAQEQGGARISGFYAGAVGEGETNVGVGGAVGYRCTPRVGFDFEALALPDFDIDESGGNGRGVAFLTNFVTEFPSRTDAIEGQDVGVDGGAASAEEAAVHVVELGTDDDPEA